MSDDNSSNSNSGIGFFGLLFIAFLVLKLTQVIDWSWWWVTAPLWGPLALVMLLIVIAGIISAVSNSGEKTRARATRRMSGRT